MSQIEEFYLPSIHNALRSSLYQIQQGRTDRGFAFIHSALKLLKTMIQTYKITQIYEDGQRRPRFRHLTEESANQWLRWLARNEPEGQAQIEPEIDRTFNTTIIARQEKLLLAGLIRAGLKFKPTAEDFGWLVLQGQKLVCEIRFEGSEWLLIPKASRDNYGNIYPILDSIREDIAA